MQKFDLNSKPLYSSHEFSAMGFIEVLPLIFKSKKDIILTCKYKGKV